MSTLITIIVTFFAGMGAGLGTGFAGLSAAADKPYAHYIFGNGSLYGSGNSPVV